MTDIAHELGNRMKPTNIRQHAKEVAVRKTVEVKNRVLDSPVALGIIGGLITTGIARLLKGGRRSQEWQASYGYAPGYRYAPSMDAGDFEREGLSERASQVGERLSERIEDVKERASETASRISAQVGDKAGELKQRASQAVETVRERLPSGEELRRGARDATETVRHYVGDEPLIGALAAISVGAALGFLIPVSRREREVVGPYKERATEKLQAMSEQISEQLEEKVGQLEERIAGSEQKDERGTSEQQSQPSPEIH